VDLDGRSVSILGVGGKGNVADFARNKDKPDRPEFKAEPEWQHQQIGPLKASDVEAKYPLLSEVVTRSKGWIER
jgi:hypothetical protein